MLGLTLIAVCLILSEMMKPKRRNRYHHYGNSPYDAHYSYRPDYRESEDEMNRIAGRYTLIFLVLLFVALYLANGMPSNEVIVAKH